ncbi:hypothetical protein FRC16_008861 [Serendipita sp. 398]|nr:hypothetical protein FRC16_008861 [Serendipita sp. 398]
MPSFESYLLKGLKWIPLKQIETHPEQRILDEGMVKLLVEQYGNHGPKFDKDTDLDVTYHKDDNKSEYKDHWETRLKTLADRRYILLGGQHRVMAIERWNQNKPDEKKVKKTRARVYDPGILERQNLVAWMTSLNVVKSSKEATLGEKLKAIGRTKPGSDEAKECIALVSKGSPEVNALTRMHSSSLYPLLETLASFPLFSRLDAHSLVVLVQSCGRCNTKTDEEQYFEEVFKDAIEQHQRMESISQQYSTIRWNDMVSLNREIDYDEFCRVSKDWELEKTEFESLHGLWNAVTMGSDGIPYCFGQFIVCRHDLHWRHMGQRFKQLIKQAFSLVSLSVACLSYPTFPPIPVSIWAEIEIGQQLQDTLKRLDDIDVPEDLPVVQHDLLTRTLLMSAPGIIGDPEESMGGIGKHVYKRLESVKTGLRKEFRSIYTRINIKQWDKWVTCCEQLTGVRIDERTAFAISSQVKERDMANKEQTVILSPRKRKADTNPDSPPSVKRAAKDVPTQSSQRSVTYSPSSQTSPPSALSPLPPHAVSPPPHSLLSPGFGDSFMDIEQPLPEISLISESTNFIEWREHVEKTMRALTLQMLSMSKEDASFILEKLTESIHKHIS